MVVRRVEQIIFFLTLFFLPTQLGKHFWPPFSYIYSLPVDYLSPTLYFWDALVVALLGVWMLSFFTNKKEVVLNKLAVNLFLLFLLCILLSFFKAKNLGASFADLIQIFIAGAWGVFIASRSWEEIKGIFFWGVSSSLIVEGILALYQFFSTHTLGLWILGERNFDVSTPSIATFNFFGQVFLRPYATFPHPNLLAAFMVLMMPILYGFRVLSDPSPNRRPRSFHSLRALVGGPPVSATRNIALLLGFLAAVFSFSRTAWLVLGVEVVFVFRKRWKYLILPLIVLAPLIWIRYNSAFNFDYLSILRREQLNQIALRDFISSPILGIGLNNFIPKLAGSSLVAGPSRFLQPAHNIVLLALAETGVVGLLGWIALVGIAVKRLWRSKNKELSKILLFSWGIILFLGMFDHYFLTLPQGQRLFFLIWGLSLGGF